MEELAERLGLVTELVTLSRPPADVISDLAHHPYDVDAELVTLGRDHVQEALRRYLQGELDEVAVEAWANAIELRDDIALPDGDDFLKETLYELANQAVRPPLNASRALTWLRMLEGTAPAGENNTPVISD